MALQLAGLPGPPPPNPVAAGPQLQFEGVLVIELEQIEQRDRRIAWRDLAWMNSTAALCKNLQFFIAISTAMLTFSKVIREFS